MNAQDLRHKIRFVSVAQDADGNQTESDIATVRAKVDALPPSVEGGQPNEQVTSGYMVIVRYRADITLGTRAVLTLQNVDIRLEVKRPTVIVKGRHKFLQLRCEQAN